MNQQIGNLKIQNSQCQFQKGQLEKRTQSLNQRLMNCQTKHQHILGQLSICQQEKKCAEEERDQF